MTQVMSKGTRTGTTIPTPVPHEQARPQLVHDLNTGPRLMILSAPSGTGKTTLLAQWARQWSGTPLWITLRQDHQDPTVLIQHLIDTTRHAGLTLPRVTRLTPTANRQEQWLAWLDDLNDVPEPLAIILDQGEHLDPPSAELVSQILHHLHACHRLLIAQLPTSVPLDTLPATVLTEEHLQEEPLQHHQPLSERLAALPPTWRTTLVNLSVLDSWTDDSAAALHLTLPFTWAALLSTDLPLTPVERGVAPHHTLLQHLQTLVDEASTARLLLHARAAEWAERRGQPYTAITHHLHAGHPEQAAWVAAGLLDVWERHSDWVLCRNTLERIGEAHLNPAQRALLALALTETADPERGEALAHQVNAEEPSATAYLALALQAFRRGDRETFGQHIAAGERAANRQQELVQMGRLRAIWYQLGHDLESASQEARKAVRRAQAISETSLHLSALDVLSFVLTRQGRTDEALIIYEQILEAGLALGYLHRMMSTIDRLTKLYLDRGRVTDAERMLTPYLEIYQHRYPQGLPTVLGSLADVHIARQEPAAALARLREAFRLDTHLKNAQGALKHGSALIVLLTLHEGRAGLEEAHEVMASARFESDLSVNRRLVATAEAYLLAAQEDWARALAVADRAQDEEYAQEGTYDYLLALVQARAALALGQPTPSHLERMAQASVQYPSDQHFLDLNPHWRDLLQRAGTAAGWQGGAAEECRPEQPLSPRTALQVTTLGSVQLSFADEPLQLPSVPTTELLIALLLHGSARQDDLAQDVWPHRDIKRARSSAQVARSTINAATGIPLILTEGRGRTNPLWTLNPEVGVQLDVQTLLTTTDPQRVRELHGGAFLTGHDAAWVLQVREDINAHLRRVYQTAIHSSPSGQALRWACELAVITQAADDFEAVRTLAQTQGHPDLALQAERALRVLAQGETVTLRHVWAP